jgi:FixJ family two-component response regulator
LVVPDQERREALAGMFAPLGERLIEFERAYTFLNTVDEASHGVVLMDLALPDIHSLVVIETLRVNEIELPIIVLSGDASGNDACGSVDAGAVEVIFRDASPWIIADAVRRQLNGPRP